MADRQELAELEELDRLQSRSAVSMQDRQAAPQDQDSMKALKGIVGSYASHIAGVANPISKLILPQGMQGSDMQQAMDPEGQHNLAYQTGQAQAVGTPVMAGAALAGPAVAGQVSQAAASNPGIAAAAQTAGKYFAGGAGASLLYKLLGLGRHE